MKFELGPFIVNLYRKRCVLTLRDYHKLNWSDFFISYGIDTLPFDLLEHDRQVWSSTNVKLIANPWHRRIKEGSMLSAKVEFLASILHGMLTP